MTSSPLPHRAGRKAREFQKNEIAMMLELEVIKPSQTELASSNVFIPKTQGTLLFFVGYRKLNAVTMLDSYPITGMDECTD